MIFVPNIKDYDLKELIALFVTTKDDNTKEKLRIVILSKFSERDFPLFYYVNKFKTSKNADKEIYADAILMRTATDITGIDLVPIEQVIESASLEALGYYGMNSNSIDIRNRCLEEFYSRGMEIEPKIDGKECNTPKRKLRII